jgi:23S rRNA (guanine745-N1)-methyltransferase
VAREGYVNLLAGRRLAPTVGDAPAMLRARRRFLDRGLYAPLADAITSHVLARCTGLSRPMRVLDAGCGEGYYLGRLAEALTGGSSTEADGHCLYGIDVSKHAAGLAARRVPGALVLVADVTGRLPFDDGTMDVLLSVFAPRNPAEFARVLRPGGMLLAALPQPDHLAGPRALLGLLDIEQEKEQRLIERLRGRFHLTGKRTLSHDLALDAEAARDLVLMTPSYRHLEARGIALPSGDGRIDTRAAFSILTFERIGDGEGGEA